MKNPRAIDPGHPLLMDRQHLDHIKEIMYSKIQKTLFPWSAQRRRPLHAFSDLNDGDIPERTLNGSGVGAEDVLSEALISLLQFQPERLEGSWEGLAVTIAHKKAVDALRATGKGLRGTNHRDKIHLVSGDAERELADGETGPTLFESMPSDGGDPEDEYIALESGLKMRDLAGELLDEREREILFLIHFRGRTRREIGHHYGLSGQRIGQIYDRALRTLEAHPDYPFRPLIPIGQRERSNR